MDERKRDSMIAYLRRRMSEVGIELDDLAAAIAEDKIKEKDARYRSATGEIWSGEGEMPQWLKQAISAGQSTEHFAVKRMAPSIIEAPATIDWSQDPFAGSRLAAVQPSHR
ncbi:H-NS histone family protein [Paraburkholderia sp. LEh10]|uniref:H-NS family nucleoid-associated regulatory protein n=1 Tax=Paraburkholderia sp. LEh10 TaxID=2821353 RepID=UPI001AE4D0EE|nr:H-NS family nucleoid-associated regulatory protein [Paraburkholderia sp. LEh10]MBP0590382.1 H-NS histone family protein [Paraburkholderia sp. LEh10]